MNINEVVIIPPSPDGKIPSTVKNLTGMRFNKLLVIRYEGIRSKGRERFSRWLCKCDCGNETIALGIHIKIGNTKSCGCLSIEHARNMGFSKRTHGLSKSKERYAWEHMIKRCYSKTTDQFKNYGARGIIVCERWHIFENFIEDMGMATSKKHSLDRIDVNGNYCKDNCRWATQKQQQQNRRNNYIIEHLGEKKSLAEWCDILGLKYKLIYARLKQLGWSVDDAFTKPAGYLSK